MLLPVSGSLCIVYCFTWAYDPKTPCLGLDFLLLFYHEKSKKEKVNSLPIKKLLLLAFISLKI
jgi:hypothetical protein